MKPYKTKIKDDDDEEEDLELKGDFEYVTFVYLKIYGGYDFIEATREVKERDADLLQDFNRPNEPWVVDLEFQFPPYLGGEISSEYDPYSGDFTDHVVEVTARDERGDYLTVEYELHLEPLPHQGPGRIRIRGVSIQVQLRPEPGLVLYL